MVESTPSLHLHSFFRHRPIDLVNQLMVQMKQRSHLEFSQDEIKELPSQGTENSVQIPEEHKITKSRELISHK